MIVAHLGALGLSLGVRGTAGTCDGICRSQSLARTLQAAHMHRIRCGFHVATCTVKAKHQKKSNSNTTKQTNKTYEKKEFHCKPHLWKLAFSLVTGQFWLPCDRGIDLPGFECFETGGVSPDFQVKVL